jgi:peptidyl-prolyl cis-trans isomerase B (cyclophilin B)
VPRVAAIAVATLALVAAGCGGGSSSSTSAATETAETVNGCESVEAPAPRDAGGATAPKERLDPERTWTLTFDTSCGTFVVTLDLDSAPATAASLVSLAQSGFYDDTVFHRIVPGFVIQGGDPTQTGSGGPGYQTVDPPAADAKYVAGVVAMAKTGAEPAGTSGSQFFVVTGADVGLPPDYAIVGKVTEGMETVDRIGKLGDPATEQPTQPVVVESVTVREQ